MLCTKAESKRHPDLCDRWINETIRDHSRLNGFLKSRLLLSFCSFRMLSVGSRDAQPKSRIRTSTRPRPDSSEIVPSPSLSIHVLWRQYYIQYISVLSMTELCDAFPIARRCMRPTSLGCGARSSSSSILAQPTTELQYPLLSTLCIET